MIRSGRDAKSCVSTSLSVGRFKKTIGRPEVSGGFSGIRFPQISDSKLTRRRRLFAFIRLSGFLSRIDESQRHGEAGGVVEIPEVLNREEKAVDHVSDEDGLQSDAQVFGVQIAAGAGLYRPHFDYRQTAQRRQDDD